MSPVSTFQNLHGNVNDFNLSLHSPNKSAPPVRPKIKYSEIKDSLKTGDIILVDGKYSYSFVMDILQGSDWGHAAMVVRSLDIDPDNTLNLPDPLLWESNCLIKESTINCWGEIKGYKDGPMLISLQERLVHSQSKFDGVYIAWKSLVARRSGFDYKALAEYFDSVINRTFPTSNSQIVGSVLLAKVIGCEDDYKRSSTKVYLDLESGNFATEKPASWDSKTIKEFNGNVRGSSKTMYCTELIAETYQKLGLLTNCPTSPSYVPKDFSDTGRLNLLQNSRLEEEIFIDILN